MSIWDWDSASLDKLSAFLEGRGITRGRVTTRGIGDGHSNLTYLVSDGFDNRVVLRRPPPPPTPPGAHDMLREAQFISALAGSSVPVAQCLATAEAGEVIDVHFYVMSFAQGPVVTDKMPVELNTPEICEQISINLIDRLADLHQIDWQEKGLAGLGKPEGFNARHRRSMARLVADEAGNPPPHFLPISEWLDAEIPAESGATLIHNDYRIGNVILSTEHPGQIKAVLDWELATLGDPLFDLGYFLGSIPDGSGVTTPTQEMGVSMLQPGFLDRDALLKRYVNQTGADLTNLSWYEALAQWKLATLYEYGRRRAERGVGDPYFKGHSAVLSFLQAAHSAAGLPPLSDAIIEEATA